MNITRPKSTSCSPHLLKTAYYYLMEYFLTTQNVKTSDNCKNKTKTAPSFDWSRPIAVIAKSNNKK